jgi:carboxylate-amine ligase
VTASKPEVERFERCFEDLSVIGERCIGLEQEFFLVNERGALSERADEFLDRCQKVAEAAGEDPGCFAPECSPYMVEINAPPAHSLAELSREHLERVQLALIAGWELGLRLYPLATYPLGVNPEIRNDPHYQLQARTVGRERFAHAGRCAGVHLHLEVPGAVDPRVGVSYDAERAAREELLNLYNLGTALDPAIIALTRSCPYYAGVTTGLAMRTALYRGDPELAPYGLYAQFEEVGGLRPYAASVGELVELQFSRYHAWLEYMDRAGVDRKLFFEMGGGLLEASSWNPVRLNPLGTIELRGIDSNYPRETLAVCALVSSAAERVRRERMSVLPHQDVRAFEVVGSTLLVPAFDYLDGDLFRAASTGGVKSREVVSYLDSILEFARAGCETAEPEEIGFEGLKVAGRYRTTEADILQNVASPVSQISEEEGLELVRRACDELEEQVVSLYFHKTTKAGTDGN